MVVPRKHRTIVENTHPCGICKAQPFKYICPRCNLRYCSLACYKDSSHVQCTESFYKSSVMEELKSSPAAAPQDRKKMLGILDRFERQAVDEEQLLASMSDEDLLRHAHQRQNRPKDSSSGNSSGPGTGIGGGAAATSERQRKLTPKEREELLRKAMEEEAKEGTLPDENDDENIDPEERAEMERMVEQEYQDFVNRFAGVDLDQESFESMWERLNPEERREFQEKFMISGRLNEDDGDDDQDGGEDDGVKGISDDDNEDERREAKKLLQEMGETLERGGQKVGSEGGQAMTAELDTDDLKAIRDAEIAELIQIWRPWWEIEAEEGGELKKVVVSKFTENEAQEKQELERLKAASNIILQQGGSTTSTATTGAGNMPCHPHPASNTVLEQFVLDEEAMLRPHQALVRPVEEIEQEAQRRAQSTVPPMTKAPHPSLIYHVCGLLFAFAATIRVFNGDLQEEPEQVLAHVFDLCPFFAPPPPSKSSTPGSTAIASVTEVMQVEDFETTLAVLQTASLNSKLWKGDTVRLEMLSLLLRDLTLILTRPSRCLRCIQDLEAVFQACLAPFTASAKTTKRRGGLLSKTTLHRLLKKLEFYESYLLSEELLLKSDRLDRVRTEVVMAGIRVRQEMISWNQELEQVSRVVVDGSSDESGVAAAAGEGNMSGGSGGGGVKERKVLIEELS